MMRCAVAVLLVFSFPSLILAQHHAEGGASSGSSSPGGSSGGYSGGSTGGGYSGASSASSGGGHSGGSNSGYSGGSSGSHSSNSASSSSSSGGGSHSSGSSGYSRSSGSSAGTASSSRSPEAGRSGSTSSSPRSNLRYGEIGAEQTSLSRESFSSRGYSQVFHDAGNQAFSVESLVGYDGNDFNKALKSGSLNPVLLQLGLEPSRKAYDAAVASADRRAGIATPKNPNWFSRAILGKQKAASAEPGLAMLPKPCLTAGCPPAPRPPKPCVGKNCKPAPPPLPPGGCHSGVTVGGTCRPWGYLNNCHRRGSCSVQFAPVDTSYCDFILYKIQQLRKQLQSQGITCAVDSQSADCVEIVNLRKQFQMCTMAAQIADPFSSGLQIGSTWP